GPFARGQMIVDGGVEVPKGDPVERLDQGFVVIAEARERAAEDSPAREGRRVVNDFLLADRQAPQVLAGDDRAGDDHEEIAAERVACPWAHPPQSPAVLAAPNLRLAAARPPSTPLFNISARRKPNAGPRDAGIVFRPPAMESCFSPPYFTPGGGDLPTH